MKNKTEHFIKKYDEQGNMMYVEYPDGTWIKVKYNTHGNMIYSRDSEGRWIKYNNEGNVIDRGELGEKKMKNETEYLIKEIDAQGNILYFEDRNGYWERKEFDTLGNEIYWENSRGVWAKYNSEGNIVNRGEKVKQKISETEYPIKKHDTQGNLIYLEYPGGVWFKYEYDARGNEIFWESSNGIWFKYKYDTRGNIILSENSNGFWVKYKYDNQGNKIYLENSDGRWEKFNNEGNVIDRGKLKEILLYIDGSINVVENPISGGEFMQEFTAWLKEKKWKFGGTLTE